MDERVIAASPDFTLAALDYALPPELIAQLPTTRRDAARLLAVDRRSGSLEDRRIADLPDLLRAGDLLVLNDTKVLPAKFFARRATGGLVKGLFLQLSADGLWEVMLESSGRLRVGESLTIENSPADQEGSANPAAEQGPAPGLLRPVTLEIREKLGGGRWYVRPDDARSPEDILQHVGHPPLPPYIGRPRPGEPLDHERYQTVYAIHPGAVAAPTAGLHFTPELLDRIRERGVEIAFVTLHVGVGTFKPITSDRLANHPMHAERFELPELTARAVNECKSRGGRVVAVGTTSVRVLETAAGKVEKSKSRKGEMRNSEGATERQSDAGDQNRVRQEAEGIVDCRLSIVDWPGTAQNCGCKPAPGSESENRELEVGPGQRETGGLSENRAAFKPIDNRQSTIDNMLVPCRGSTDIFIYPPYEFRIVDALLTNFHLPRSTLLALVMAFAGTDLTRRAYQHAISQRYRFYSYGDAMWIA